MEKEKGKNKKPKLLIIPLGGIDESGIGKNMTAIQYGNDLIVVDCGSKFPDQDTYPGIDVTIPDMQYLSDNADKLRGFLITHGHEDHIGALPYALEHFDVPVYGTDFTLALVQHKLEEKHLSGRTLIQVAPGEKVTLGCFEVEAIKTSHSIVGSVAYAISTPVGTVIHTGDFRVELSDGGSGEEPKQPPIDLQRLAWYGSKGVLALLADSTNVERKGFSRSESELLTPFRSYFATAKGRIFVATFASNIGRVRQIARVALESGRFLCFQGRSLEQNTQIAMLQGYLDIPSDRIVDVDHLRYYRNDQICVITTGSQGELMSGLSRMAGMAATPHKLVIGEGDTVIISASIIPGNEMDVTRLVDTLYKRGARVYYSGNADVHVSGHPSREDLRLLYQLLRPKYYIPIHGEAHHLYIHEQFAVEMGVPAECVFRAEQNGDVIELTARKARIAGRVPTGEIAVDGGEINDQVMRDRLQLANDGILVATLIIDIETGRLMAEPEIISRGFVYMRESGELMDGVKAKLMEEARRFERAPKGEYSSIKENIRKSLRNYLKMKTQRTPIIVPSVIEI